jgi:hypothetical protein
MFCTALLIQMLTGVTFDLDPTEKCMNSIQQILTIECSVTYDAYNIGKGAPVKTSASKARYCSSVSKYRITEDKIMYIINTELRTLIDVYSDGKTLLEVNKSNMMINGGIHAASRSTEANCDLRNACLFNIIAPRFPSYHSLSHFLSVAKIKSLKKLPNTTIHELNASAVFDDLDLHYVIHFDESFGCLISRLEVDIPSAFVKHVFVVEKFHEPEPAIYVPNVVARRCYIKGVLDWYSTTTTQDVKVNKSLKNDALTFSFPHGTQVYDSIRSAHYRVDSKGNRVSTEQGIVSGQTIGAKSESVIDSTLLLGALAHHRSPRIIYFMPQFVPH